MANAIPPEIKAELPPAINELAPFARASVFGDVRDLYRHAPTARIGANYTPSAHARLLERPKKGPPKVKRTGLETNAEILRMPAPTYPSVNHPPRDPKTGLKIDPRAAVAVTPLERLERKKTGDGHDSPDNPFNERDGGSSEEDRAEGNHESEASTSGADGADGTATTSKKRKFETPFEYTSARRKEIADAMVRYFYYVEHGVPDNAGGFGVSDAHLAPPKQEWFERTLALVPPEPKGNMTRARFETLILEFLEEMRLDQARAARKAVVDYALTDAHERQRLGVESLAEFLPAPPGSALAAERHRRARHVDGFGTEDDATSRGRRRMTFAAEIGASASSHFAPSPYVSLPRGWSASVDDARFALERGLRVNTWHALELAREWHVNHVDEPLCDVTSETFTRSLPYEADAFDAFQKAACERAKNGIWDSWRSKSVLAFQTNPPPVESKGGGNGDVYEAMATQQSSELRALVRRRVGEYASFFENRSFSDEHLDADPLSERLLWDKEPVFVVRLVPHVTETETRVEVVEEENGEEGEEEETSEEVRDDEEKARTAAGQETETADETTSERPFGTTEDDAASIATEPDTPEGSVGGKKRRFVTRIVKSAEARFDPPLDAVARIAVGALDRFVLAAAGVPRVCPPAPPKKAVREMTAAEIAAEKSKPKPKTALSSATLEDSPIAEARRAVHVVMLRAAIAPRGVAGLFDPHLRLLTIDAEAHARTFAEAEKTLPEYKEEIDAFLAEARTIENLASERVMCGAYSVDCSRLKSALADAARRIAEALTDSIRAAARESNEKIVAAYETIQARVTRVSETGEACVGLKTYMKFLPAELEQLKAAIAFNAARDEFLHEYFRDQSDEDLELSVLAKGWPLKCKAVLLKASVTVEKEYKVFEKEVKARRKAFAEALEARKKEIAEFRVLGDVVEREAIASKVDALAEAIEEALTESQEINAEERLFSFAPTKYAPQINAQISSLDPFKKLWQTTRSMFRNHRDWLTGPFSTLVPETMDEAVQDAYRIMFKLQKVFSGLTGGDRLPEPLKAATATLAKIEDFKTYQPLIDAVCNPGLRDRHWIAMTDVIDVVGFELKRDDHTSLKKLLDKGVLDHLEKIAECSDVASREFNFEKALDKMIADWKPCVFGLKDWKATGTCIMEGAPMEEAQTLLDEHIVKTQAMRASPFAIPFMDRVVPWEARLTRLQDIVDAWLRCQSKWLYLEPIFNSEEIMKQIPTEGAAFMKMDQSWRRLVEAIRERPAAMDAPEIPNLLEDLQAANHELDVVEKGLNDFLDTKKLAFPRFFFLSNDELLEILSEAKDPLKIQPFMKKCFEAVKEVEFTDNVTMRAMISVEGERVPLSKEIDPAETNAVECWMLEFEDVMKVSIREVTEKAVAEYVTKPRERWILEWPGQVVLAASQVHWTAEVTAAIEQGGAKKLAEYGEKCNGQLTNIVNMVRGELSKLERATMASLVVIDVHARDVVQQMSADGVSDPKDFKWLAQLRYFWEDGDLAVRMINAEARYGYEYLGNSTRLVITPLTDRCYRTLMGAIHLNLGGAPAGPAGTGKTETTKDLSKAIAIQCVVFNCSDGLDYKAMGKFFKGLAASGAWACFDEFNRIELEVLSVVAQQVLCIQRAVAARVKTFVFEGVELRLIPTANVFITMNPGYAGRSELPDNLKALFRDVAMMVPDYAMIAEIIMYSYGYLEARDMARKLVQTYRLCSEQLSSQDHYDYGMRAVISVLRAAGNLKRKFVDEREDILMLRAITDVNLPKFLDQDVPLFRGILSDLFPGVELPEIDYENLVAALEKESKRRNLQPLPTFFEKIIQLYEMIIVRHGLMIVGESFGMKSSCISVLAAALGDLCDQKQNNEFHVKYFCINPKSVTMAQLYGAEDAVSKEWADGVLAVTFRNAARDTSPDRKWVVFDGPVDAIWIENMNTVLDDNKKLCLNSGEIIAMQGLMNMIFEVQDLAVASPATVSRCGMVYVQPSLLGWRPVMVSWMNTLPEGLTDEHKAHIEGLFDWLLPPCVRLATKECKMPQPMHEINLAQACMRLLDALLADFKNPALAAEMNKNVMLTWLDSLFLFALVWSAGAAVDEEGRKKFDATLRGLLIGEVPEALQAFMTKNLPPNRKVTQLFPDAVDGKDATVYDFVFDKPSGKWVAWVKTREETPIPEGAQYTDIIVPTVDTIRYTFLIDVFVNARVNFLFVGPTGTGKTAYIKRHISHLADETEGSTWSYLFMNFSAQTSANQTQDVVDGKLDKRRKGVFGPPIGKKMVVFVDDLNMPQVEEYGAQPPIELLRQSMDYDGWYDRKELTFRKIVDVKFCAAMGPPGGGRNNVTNRYLRHYSLVCASAFDDAAMSKIFGALTEWWSRSNEIPAPVARLQGNLVAATVDLYRVVQRELLPTPTKSHYTFNLRDVSKVFQMVCSASAASVPDPDALTRLWVHESLRVFHDRLTDDPDREWFFDTIKRLTEKHFPNVKFDKCFQHLDSDGDGSVDANELRKLMFGDFLVPGADPRVYEEVTEYSVLHGVVSEYLGDFNATSKKPMRLVLFLFALEHVCRICRIVSQPGGHALLVGVGGSGRQSLTKLAAYMQEYTVFQIEVSQTYGKQEWHDDLRALMRLAGEQNKKTVFLFSDTQINHEFFVEDISNILNTGEVPNLMEAGDLGTIFETIRGRAKAAGMDGSKDAMTNFFFGEVRRNLHVVLCFSPVGEAFRERLRKFPSLVTCTTIDWFSAWPVDALRNVAVEFLAAVNAPEEKKPALAEMCVAMHSMVTELSARYLSEARRHFYVTPTSYLELISSYKDLLEKKQRAVQDLRNRYDVGLEKLVATEKSVAVMQDELTALQPELVKAGEETAAAMVVIAAETVEADKVKVLVAKDEATASEEAARVKAIKDDCEKDLAQAMPMLNKAIAALDTLSAADISQVKGFSSPPAPVKLVMEAVCICKGVKPTRVKLPDGKMGDDYWDAAKKMLMDPKFLESLKKYDKDNIKAKVIKKIRPYLAKKDFQLKVVKKASKAAYGLCSWVRAMEAYDRVAKVVGPKRVQLAAAEKDLSEVMAALKEKQDALQAVVDKIQNLNDDLEAKKAYSEKLERDVEMCKVKLERAEKLIGGLGGEKIRWTASSRQLVIDYEALTGDVLLSSGCIAYLGAFSASYREQTTARWVELCAARSIQCDAKYSLVKILGDAVKIREWNIQGLPKDTFSSENGVMMEYGRRWPLFIDPQSQANEWVRTMEKSNGLVVCKLSDENFARSLETAVEFGKPVLLENVRESLDASLEGLLLKQTFKQGGTLNIKIGDITVPYHEDFKLYITTKLRNPHYTPELCTKVSLINFMITVDGLEDQLLGVVVAKERPDLAEEKNQLIIQGAQNKKQLNDIEEQILAVLSSSEGNILEDENAVKILSASKTLSDEISEKQKVADATEAKIDATRAGYRPVAKHSSIVFFCVADMASIGDMYQYSLQWFTDLFVRGIEDAPTDPRVAKRLKNITEHFTFFLYVNVCRSLFEKDKLLFSFLVTTKLLLAAAEENKRKAEEEAASVAKAEREAAEEEKRIADARAARIAAGEDVEAEERAAREAEERAALEAEEEARLAAEEAAEAAREAEENGSDGEDEDPERSEARLENDGELAFSDDDEPRAGEDDGDPDDAGGTKEGIESEELRFFLTGGISTGDVSKPNPAPEWLSDKAWGELLRMTDLPTVAARGDVPSDVANDPNRWKVLYDSPEPQDEALPSPFHESFSPLQRMLVLRAFRPDKVVPAITEYVGKEMGAAYVDPLPFDLDACFADSDAGTPLVFILSPGSDPMANLLKFAETKTRKKEGAKPDDAEVPTRVEAVSLGQGQGPFALRCIETGAKEGHWVVLQNCHLAKSFMPELEQQCELRIKREDVHPDFRLWLTSYPSPIFPVSILENSVKMTNEAPSGLKAGLARTFLSDPLSDSAFFETCTKDQTWRKMVFGLAFFHSFVQERAKYGAIGFNIPYQFNENDLRISIRQLKMFLDEYDETPYETLRYTCGECNYGGKVTDGHDRITVDCILKLFYTPEIVNDDYAFSPSGTYRAPKHGEYGEYLAYIDSLPRVAAPEVYGFHANADIAKDVKDTDEFLDAFSLTQSRDGVKGGVSPEEAIGAVAMDLSEKCPDSFDVERAAMKYPVDYFESMNTVLTQELVRVNALLAVVRSSLTNLGKAVKGLVLMSDELDQVGKALYDGKVPALWLKKSFPSLKPLGSYFKELVERCAFFETWVKQGVPDVFPLYAFFFTQAFLTGSKQNFARKYKVEIDKVDFDFKVLEGSAESYADKKPEDGVYCFGMFLDGAAWSAEKKSLTESEPKVLYAPCPGVHMIPRKIEDFDLYSNYSCPLYKTADRRGILSTTGHSTNFVMNIRLPSERDADHWIRRGACLLLSLKD
jgi:dynein heavy chain